MAKKFKPIKIFNVVAPDKGTKEDPNTYARFLLIPYFREMEKHDNHYEAHCNIILNDKTVGKEFFDKMEDLIYWEYPILLSRWHFVEESSELNSQ